MTFEYIIEKDNSEIKLSKEEVSNLAKKISADFSELNSERAENLQMASDLANEIFFKNDFKSIKDKTQRWKAKVKMCKTYMFYQTLKAYIWRNTYANVNSMFDVSGENHDSNNNSNKQKAMLVDILEKMNFQKTCDKVIDNALLYGELVSFTAWKKNYEEYRRPISFFENLFSEDITKLPRIMKAIKDGKNFWTDEKKIYDNPYIYPVNPADLVFDSNQIDNWDSCPKIYRTYKTPNDIVNNQYYQLNAEEKQQVYAMVSKSDNCSNSAKDEIVNGSMIEVLEHWGDLKLADGTVLKNWHAVVVGRKFLVEFGKNERIINPFSYGAFITDPTTKRGVSPLYCVLSLAHLQEDLLNRTCNLQSLNENPPLLAPEGFFDKDEIELYPGKIIEYGDNLTPTAAFQQLNFNPTVFLQDISFLNDLMAEVSGIFPNMIGAVESSSPKTATEINTKSQGQMTRLAMIVDIINQDYILPCVEKVAKLCADFKMGTERIFINSENQPEEIEIDDEIRQAEYKYTYSDSSQTALKSEQADMLVTAVEKFAQQIPLNLEEIFIWYFEQKGVDNPERFLGAGVNEGVGVNGVNGVNGNPQLNPELLQALIQNIPQNQKDEQTPKEENSQNVSQEDSENTQSSDLAALLTKLIGKETK